MREKSRSYITCEIINILNKYYKNIQIADTNAMALIFFFRKKGSENSL